MTVDGERSIKRIRVAKHEGIGDAVFSAIEGNMDTIRVELRGDSRIALGGRAVITVTQGRIELFGSICVDGESRKISMPLWDQPILISNYQEDCDQTTIFTIKSIEEIKQHETHLFASPIIFGTFEVTYPAPHHGCLRSSASWYLIASRILSSSVDRLSIAICGPRDVGKSSLSRLLVNLLLADNPSILYIDLDVGQSEFTPPGLVSVVKVFKPLLGAPHTHQKAPEWYDISFIVLRSIVQLKEFSARFIGDVSSASDHDRYIAAVQSISSYLASLGAADSTPIVINTPGWVKGFGLNVLTESLNLLHPRFIIDVQSSSERNQPHRLTSLLGFKTELLTIPAPLQPFRTEQRKISPSDCRNISYAAYFCGNNLIQNLSVAAEYLASIRPYQVPFDSVKIHILNAPHQLEFSESLRILNCSIVGLCIGQDNGDCVGLAIVRSIDTDRRVYHLLTPVEHHRLKHVTCLVRGRLQIPTALLAQQRWSVRNAPYLSSTPRSKAGLGSFTMKSRGNIQRRGLSRVHNSQ